MHELAVTQNILDIVLRHARQENAGHVSDVYLVIGKLSSIVDDSVQFYWDFVSEGTVAEGAILNFRRIPAKLMCLACNEIYSPDENLTCPRCESSQVKIVSGQQFYIESIAIEPSNRGSKAVSQGNSIT